MRSSPALLLGLVAVPVRDAGAAHRLNAKPSPLTRAAPAAATRAASGGLARAACALRGGGESFFGDLYDFSDQAGSAAVRPRRASAPRGQRPSLGLPAGLLWFAVKSLSLIAVAGSGVFVGRSTARARSRGVRNGFERGGVAAPGKNNDASSHRRTARRPCTRRASRSSRRGCTA